LLSSTSVFQVSICSGGQFAIAMPSQMLERLLQVLTDPVVIQNLHNKTTIFFRAKYEAASRHYGGDFPINFENENVAMAIYMLKIIFY